MPLVKITKWAGKEIDPHTEDPQWYGTLDCTANAWPGFLSFDGFEDWREDYDTQHADVPNHTSWEEVSFDELPPAIKELKNGAWWTLKDHIDWMLEDENSEETE